MTGLPSRSICAGVRPNRAGKNSDQRGFASPVLSDERVNFARADVQRNPIKGLNARVGLRYVADCEKRFGSRLHRIGRFFTACRRPVGSALLGRVRAHGDGDVLRRRLTTEVRMNLVDG